MTEQSPAYTYTPGPKKALDHMRRYPRHYGALVLWLVAMLLVPTVASGAGVQTAAPASSSDTGVGSGVTAESPATAGPAATTASSPTALGAAATSLLGATTGTRPSSSPSAPSSAPTPAPSGAGEEEDEESGEVESPVPAGPETFTLPPPPATPVPPVPEELVPLLAAVAPLTSQGCSAVGLAAVVAAVVGPAAGDQVPFAQLLPYLSPAYSACATFPVPEGERTICAIDEQMREAGYPADASGLAKTPNPIGIGVDVFFGIERAIEAMTGQAPGIAPQLADALGCHPDV